MKCVIDRVDDTQFWTELYKVVARTAPPTTPPPSSPAFQQTPWAFTSSVIDSRELRKNMDPLLKAELDDNLTIDHSEFVDAFFGRIVGLEETVQVILKHCETTDPPLYQKNIGWLGWPEECVEKPVLQWLQEKIERVSSVSKGTRIRTSTTASMFFHTN